MGSLQQAWAEQHPKDRRVRSLLPSVPQFASLLTPNEPSTFTQPAIDRSVTPRRVLAPIDLTTSSHPNKGEDTSEFLNRMVAEGRIPAYSLANISNHPCIVLTESPQWNAKRLEEHIWDVMLEQNIERWEDHRYHVSNWSKKLPFPYNIQPDDRGGTESFCPDETTAPSGLAREKCLT